MASSRPWPEARIAIHMNRIRSIRKEVWGRILIFMGVSAWIPYAVLEYILGRETNVVPFLAVHLSGVIPGALLVRGALLRRLISRLISRVARR